jgi:hypothetical protein
MPWIIVRQENKYCVHKEQPDKSAGDLITCHDTEEQAKQHLAALYANHEGKASVKAVGDGWEVDVLIAPFGSEQNKDKDGEYFDATTKFHEDKYPSPPAVYYHGYDEPGKESASPQYIGKTVKRWIDNAGAWLRMQLDKTSEYASRVREAVLAGTARASSGSAKHLTRRESNGHITEWPIVEASLFDMTGGKEPCNRYAVVLPAAKAIYEVAGIEIPSGLTVEPESTEPTEAVGDIAPVKAGNGETDNNIIEVKEMDEKEIQALIDKGIADAAKAKEEADTKARRLPFTEAPVVLQYDPMYDNLTPAQHDFVLDTLKASGQKLNPESIKSLVGKMTGEEGRGDAPSHEGLKAMGIRGVKADEIMHTDLSSYGSNWVGTLYSTDFWATIRSEAAVLNELMSKGFVKVIPDGYASEIIPMEYSDPTWYKVAEVSATVASWLKPYPTVPTSKVGTDSKTLTVAKMGCRVLYSGELVEDSLVAVAPQIMRQIEISGAEQMEVVIIDGDTDTTATTNINDIVGTPAGTETFLLANGFRKLPLITNTANMRSGGVFDGADMIATLQLLGVGGINALAVDKVAFIPDMNVYWKMVQLAEVKTQDVYSGATMESGILSRFYNRKVIPSAFMHSCAADRKATTAGTIDVDTTTNNSTGALLAVRWDQWAFAWKRRLKTEVVRDPDSDSFRIVAFARFGLGYRNTDASAITYNITL